MAGRNDANGALHRYLHALPKAELHLHLEGSLAPELLLRLAERNSVRLPFSHPDDFARLYRYRSFRQFANALLLGVGCLRKPEDFSDAVTDLGERLAKDNVRYAEVTWTPQFYLNRGHPLDELLAAMNAARAALRARSNLELHWIPDLVRSYPGPSRRVAAWASSEKSMLGGVVALGLGGPETGNPAEGFADTFAMARQRGLPANPHAGEGEGPTSVWQTIRHLQPTRIGHGVRSVEDPALLEWLSQHGTPLEVCLTSNVQLGVYASYEAHPLSRLIAAGCVVTLNSDDPVLFQTTLTDEYMNAVSRCGISLPELRKTILDTLRASYLGASRKAEQITRFEDAFKELAGLSPESESLAGRNPPIHATGSRLDD
jgi:aminodeoxyfutalosine deaminase